MRNRQPSLRNALVSLRPLLAADRDALFAVASDPLIWAGHPAHDRWQEPVFSRFFTEALESGGALIAADAVSGAVIGSSRFDPRRARANEVEIGWTFLSRSHWGGHHNHAMKQLMIGHALQSVEQVIFLVGETNIRSRTAMERVGARLTDRVDRVQMAGREVIHLIYAMDHQGFMSGPLGQAR